MNENFCEHIRRRTKIILLYFDTSFYIEASKKNIILLHLEISLNCFNFTTPKKAQRFRAGEFNFRIVCIALLSMNNHQGVLNWKDACYMLEKFYKWFVMNIFFQSITTTSRYYAPFYAINDILSCIKCLFFSLIAHIFCNKK